MSNIPADLRYAKSHEWVRAESDGSVTVGITDYAQNSLGDITYVQVPKVGATYKAGDVFGVVESVKAASDLYLPVAGTVVAVNAALESAPETVNRAPWPGVLRTVSRPPISSTRLRLIASPRPDPP